MQSQDYHPPRVGFHFQHAAGQDHSVPAVLLIKALENAQKALQYIAVATEGLELRDGQHIPDAIVQRYALRCALPEEGSYTMPAVVGLDYPGFDEIELDLVNKVLTVFRETLTALGRGEIARLPQLIHDSRMRGRVLQNIKAMVPSPGSGFRLGLLHGDMSEAGAIPLNDELVSQVNAAVKGISSSVKTEVITGTVVRIDFEKRLLTFVPRGLGKSIDCPYDDSLEDLLIENRRDFVQITGQIRFDEAGKPKEIAKVESICDLDLSPIELADVPGHRVTFEPPLFFSPALVMPEDAGVAPWAPWVALDVDEFELHLYAATRADLVEELGSTMTMLWEEFALEDPELLSPKAQALREKLRSLPTGEPRG
jgi:hypothetical protein